MKIRVVSWNIAGGRPTKSNEQFDYAEEDLDYFVEQIKVLNPDIVCLQESHTNNERSIAEELAEKIGLKYVFNSKNSPSHIDPEYQLGLAILSKEPIYDQSVINYPYPSFKLLWPNGNEAEVHHKALQIARIGTVSIANTQMFPINIWGYDYGVAEGLDLAQKIEEVLIQNSNRPVIFCGDFNYNNPELIYLNFVKKSDLVDVLKDEEITRPSNGESKKRPDHIFYSSEFSPLLKKIIKTNTDHYLCFAEFSIDSELISE